LASAGGAGAFRPRRFFIVCDNSEQAVNKKIFTKRTRIAAPAEAVFQWHARSGAFERLAPPWQTVEVLDRSGGIENRARVVLAIGKGPLRIRWELEHCDYVAGRQFRDVQVHGPFAQWEHRHRFEPDGETACHLEDRIEYALPLGAMGRLFGAGAVRKQLDSLFDYRHRVTAQDIEAHQRWTDHGGRRMNILVTGSSGLVGSALVPFLTTGGHRVMRLVRAEPRGEDEVRWDPSIGAIDAQKLEGIDAVVHLAGESIADGRWTPEKKAKILNSRVQGTRLLSESLARLQRRPRVLVSASAIGYYGDRGEQPLNERSAAGSGFLPDVCRQWEAATQPAVEAGIRVVNLRIGVVLSAQGGALAKMLGPFRMGAGGRLGSGRQYLSWIALDDVVGAIHHGLMCDELSGPVNAVSPNPVTNREFTKTLGRVLRRPTMFPMPAPAARVIFGEMADELLLASTRVEPQRLMAEGYEFRFAELQSALRHLLGRTNPEDCSWSDVPHGRSDHRAQRDDAAVTVHVSHE
jgi:uncharacterized protein (TIGR01777 family)